MFFISVQFSNRTLLLVTTLVENQLQGEIKLNRAEGTEFQIKFNEPE